MANQDYPTVDALAPAQIFEKAQTVGAGKASMPVGRAFVLACLAGFYIGMGGMFMLLVKADPTLPFAASSLLGGFVFSLGLFAVIVAGAELFTGNSLMLIGCLSGKYGVSDLLKSWAVVYLGNLCGSLLLVAVLFFANFAGMNKGQVGITMISVADAKCALPWATAFFRAIMCNVLVCLGVWMGFAGKTVVDKFFAAAMPVMAFVACGFEHCVANMFFIPMGLVTLATTGLGDGQTISGALNLMGMLSNLSAATLGNIVGGALLFAGAYWLAFGKKAR